MEPDISDALSRLAKGNGILFARDSPCLAGVRSSLEASDRRSVVLWGLRNAERIASIVGGRHPLDPRPREAVRLCTMWSMGDVKMPEAKRAILECHSMVKELESPVDKALCHAVGQACSTVHTKRHAMGLPIYELTAIVEKYGIENCREPVERRCAQYVDRLIYWRDNLDQYKGTWAGFMMRE